ncbi:MAG TPA: hypothetical protein VF126_15820, partial [Acidobacteriaceae bacterium]
FTQSNTLVNTADEGNGMKKARDSFYVALRDRLQVLNPSRQVMIRGVWRPGVLVEENESFGPTLPDNVFMLRWTKAAVDKQHALPRAEQVCEIQYQTAGTPTAGGMDRGALLTAMDAELLAILQPQQAQKFDYSTTPLTAMATVVFWGDAVFGPVTRERDRVVRKAEISVVSYEEAGEI